MRKRTNESGIGLLIELLFVMIISTIIMAGAIPAYQRMQAVQQETAARQQLRNVAQANAAIALCNMQAGCAVSVTVSNLIPTQPTINLQGYTFAFTPGACFIYTATPVSPSLGQHSYYIDCTGVVRFVSAPATNPTAASPVWAW